MPRILPPPGHAEALVQGPRAIGDAAHVTGVTAKMIRHHERAAFANACSASPTDAGVIFHSDRGSQYASNDFTHDRTSLGFVPSMSRKGNCWDNAVAESFFTTLKAEEANGVYETKADAYAGSPPTLTASTTRSGCTPHSATCHRMAMQGS
jgi:transposase InsO family protein